MIQKRQKKGFTLAELLIVIAIIAILIAIAIPVFSSSMRRANESTDCANIRALKAAAVAYYLDDTAAATPTMTGDTALVLCNDGTADVATTSKTKVVYKLGATDNKQLGSLGITGGTWKKGDPVQCTVKTDGSVTF